MVNLLLPTQALNQLLLAKPHLEQALVLLKQSRDEIIDCEDGAAFLSSALTSYQNYKAYMEAGQTLLLPYQQAILDPAQTWTVPQRQAALAQLGVALATAPSSPNVNWNQGQRTEKAYQSIYKIIERIAAEMYCQDMLLGALQFVRTFGGTELQLVEGDYDEDPTVAASTNIVDRDNGSGGTIQVPVIFLYTEPTGAGSGFEHLPENITHEFGHVLVFRNGRDNSDIYKQWFVSWNGAPSISGIGQYINPFEPEYGWEIMLTNYRILRQLIKSKNVLQICSRPGLLDTCPKFNITLTHQIKANVEQRGHCGLL